MRSVLPPLRLVAMVAALGLAGPRVAAAQIDLGHPTITPFLADNVGTNVDRSVAFAATSNFSIFSAGIRIDPLTVPAFTLRATLRAATPTPGNAFPTRGNILAQATAAFTDQGLGFYDVPLAFSFTAGEFYDIAFDIVEGGVNGWDFGQYNMEFYTFDAPQGAFTVGPVRVIDGGCFGPGCGDYFNNVMPHVRFDGATTVVPEPSTYALLGTGLVALGIAARRRRRA